MTIACSCSIDRYIDSPPVPITHRLTHALTHIHPSMTNAAATSKSPDVPSNLHWLFSTLLSAQSQKQTHLLLEEGGWEVVGLVFLLHLRKCGTTLRCTFHSVCDRNLQVINKAGASNVISDWDCLLRSFCK